jgi:hypothetical protein
VNCFLSFFAMQGYSLGVFLESGPFRSYLAGNLTRLHEPRPLPAISAQPQEDRLTKLVVARALGKPAIPGIVTDMPKSVFDDIQAQLFANPGPSSITTCRPARSTASTVRRNRTVERFTNLKWPRSGRVATRASLAAVAEVLMLRHCTRQGSNLQPCDTNHMLWLAETPQTNWIANSKYRQNG